ncbi:MAG: RrF2 family transcriptional regulator [Firmicutes bacterium]|nr:RrF2 family transcriptional regulator [Bacillota bacterium]
MKLTTKSRYGTRAMLDIALNCEKGPVSLKDLAQRQGISVKYLEQIIPALKAAGFIISIRGPSGGYILAKSASKIKILDLIQALEGSVSPSDCIDTPMLCPRVDECATYDVWKEVREAIDKILGSWTLADLAALQKKKAKKTNGRKRG